jgi:Aminotransferase class I and II
MSQLGAHEHAGYPVISSQANFILVQAPDEHALVSRLAEHAIAVRPGTALGIPGTVRVSVPSQRGLRLLHGALRPTPGRVMPAHGDRITMIRHMVLLGALGAGAFGGRQRGDSFQLRLVLDRGNPPSPTANHASCVGVSQPTTSAPTPPVTRFRVLADSEPSPSQ